MPLLSGTNSRASMMVPPINDPLRLGQRTVQALLLQGLQCQPYGTYRLDLDSRLALDGFAGNPGDIGPSGHECWVCPFVSGDPCLECPYVCADISLWQGDRQE